MRSSWIWEGINTRCTQALVIGDRGSVPCELRYSITVKEEVSLKSHQMLRQIITLLTLLVAVKACMRDWDALGHRMSKHDHSSFSKRQVPEYPPILTEVESILVNSFDSKSLDDWSYYYTHGDHLGGHNKTMAEWTAQQWVSAGLNASLAEYWIWATAPIESSLRLSRADGSTHDVSLIEDVLEEDETTSYPNRIPAYHAMSGSGNVTAEYVYVG